MATNLSKQIGDAMIARLQASFNSNMATIAAAYGITPVTIDFTLGNLQFFRGKFSVDDLETNNPGIVYPIAMIYTRRASNLRLTKPAMFSGDVEMGIDIVHSFDVEDEAYVNDYESILDATLETMVNVFNTRVTFPAPISYGGKLDEIERGDRQLSDREEEFTRLQRFVLDFTTRM